MNAGKEGGGRSASRWRARSIRVFWITFALVVLAFVGRFAWQTDWEAVGDAVAARSRLTLVGIALAAGASHLLFGTFEVVAHRFVDPPLSRLRTWFTAVACYALNLNLGALVGGVGMRYALYRRQGVGQGDASRLVASSVIANWSGYLLVITLLLPWASRFGWSRWLDRPWAWWCAAGVGALVLVLYFVGCARRSGFTLRGSRFDFPPLKWAVAQTALSAVNWTWMGAVMMLCLGNDISFPDALGALLAAAVAGLITHVPGGWGVIEFVVVALLADQASAAQLIAGVLVYRAAYYLLPMPAAALLYLGLGRARRKDSSRHESPPVAETTPRVSTA